MTSAHASPQRSSPKRGAIPGGRLILPVLAAAVLCPALLMRADAYLAGFHGRLAFLWLGASFVLGGGVVAAGLLGLLLAAGVLPRRADTWMWLGAAGAVCVCAVVPVFVVPGYVPFLRGFRHRVGPTANVTAIRNWALRYQPIEPDQWVGVPREDWPPSIAELEPRHVRYCRARRRVRLVWGGGFGHCGITVGPLGDAAGPDSDAYTIALENGAWVWHERQ